MDRTHINTYADYKAQRRIYTEESKEDEENEEGKLNEEEDRNEEDDNRPCQM